MRLQNDYHKVHDKIVALPFLPGARSHLNQSSGSSCERLRAQETTTVAVTGGRLFLVPAAIKVTLPNREFLSPGVRVRTSTAITLAG